MIKSFSGEYRFLSNFYPVEVLLGGVKYPTVENAYQAAKTTDKILRREFVDVTPGVAKRLGKTIPISKDWAEFKLIIMENLLRQKFSNPHLNELLLSTSGHELVEGNTWGDTFWGVCNGKGKNHLGKILMSIRTDYEMHGC